SRSIPNGTLPARLLEDVKFNIFGVYSIAYLTTARKLPRTTALVAVSLASFAMVFLIPVFDKMSDTYGRRKTYAPGVLGIALLAYRSFWLMNTREVLLVTLA